MGKAQDSLRVPHVPLAYGSTLPDPLLLSHGGAQEAAEGSTGGDAGLHLTSPPTAWPTLALLLHKGTMTVNQGAKRLPRINN